MQLLSYFHQSSVKDGRVTWNPRPLSFQSPVVVNYSSMSTQGFSGLLKAGYWVSSDHLPTVLNGSIVSIVTTSDPEFASTKTLSTSDLIPYFQPNDSGALQLPEPSCTKFFSLAITANIDSTTQSLQLLIPPHYRLQALEAKNTVLILGLLETPEWCYTEDAYYNEAQAGKGRGLRNDVDGESELGNLSTMGQVEQRQRPGEQQWIVTAKSMSAFAELHLRRKDRGHV
jgi:polynucleotide 5'-hydroxyl-kinase GRC3/NOL9